MLDACPVGEGDQVLDVGCGLGHEARRLVERVGPHGRVTGIDANAAMIAEARQRVAGLTLPIAFEVGDAHRIDFPDNTFDLCRTERVLRYLDRPETVVGRWRAWRVPADPSWPLTSTRTRPWSMRQTPALARRIAEVLDAAVPSPWIGRQLVGLFRRAGLRNVRVVPYVICFSGASGFAVYEQLNRGTIDRAVQAGQITAEEVTAWWAPLTQAAEAETFFTAVLGFTSAGRQALVTRAESARSGPRLGMGRQ